MIKGDILDSILISRGTIFKLACFSKQHQRLKILNYIEVKQFNVQNYTTI